MGPFTLVPVPTIMSFTWLKRVVALSVPRNYLNAHVTITTVTKRMIGWRWIVSYVCIYVYIYMCVVYIL